MSLNPRSPIPPHVHFRRQPPPGHHWATGYTPSFNNYQSPISPPQPHLSISLSLWNLRTCLFHRTSLENLPWNPKKIPVLLGMNCPQDWPEPIIRVQSLSDSGIPIIPDRFIKPPPDRPVTNTAVNEVNIPLIDLKGLFGDDSSLKATTLDQISQACREWGFFQVINHGVSPRLMDLARDVWRDFFHQPMEEKQAYANSPRTYEGYGSRLGVQRGAILDWSDYYFLHYLPQCLKDHEKWPALPPSLRWAIGLLYT